jgi:hypothetical protein
MIGKLLLRGLAAGLIAGLLAGVVGFAFGEPYVDRTIAIEQAAGSHHAAAAAKEPPPPVSRDGQRVGLLVASALYGAAIGGLFALAFAAARGRVGRRSDWSTAIGLAAALLVVVVVVPTLKYPANPPAVGDPETIGARTALYLTMLAISLLALLAAWRASRQVARLVAPWARGLVAVALYALVVGAAAAILPAVEEVPPGFPEDLLWGFRAASVGVQAVLWSALGVLFGLACERWPLPDHRASAETGEFGSVPAPVPDDR